MLSFCNETHNFSRVCARDAFACHQMSKFLTRTKWDRKNMTHYTIKYTNNFWQHHQLWIKITEDIHQTAKTRKEHEPVIRYLILSKGFIHTIISTQTVKPPYTNHLPLYHVQSSGLSTNKIHLHSHFLSGLSSQMELLCTVCCLDDGQKVLYIFFWVTKVPSQQSPDIHGTWGEK